MTKPKHNKQHDMRAASLKRMAKAIRATVTRPPRAEAMFITARQLAKIFEAEAKLLRSMR